MTVLSLLAQKKEPKKVPAAIIAPRMQRSQRTMQE